MVLDNDCSRKKDFWNNKLRVNTYQEWKLNNSYNWHLGLCSRLGSTSPIHGIVCFSPSSPALQSQKLKTERLFLYFCSIRTNEYALNQSANCMSYLISMGSIPRSLLRGRLFAQAFNQCRVVDFCVMPFIHRNRINNTNFIKFGPV